MKLSKWENARFASCMGTVTLGDWLQEKHRIYKLPYQEQRTQC